ncbi:MAG: hypothetical protein JWS12_901 [Candidatus Saccharibacteria bacterium]|nr:hypothetical protein [Candidatus Saccharibacteria bacterium]
MIRKILSTLLAGQKEEREAELYRNLIRHEAKIGGQLFGPVSKDGRREFFCLDEKTWIWHEEWVDNTGQRQIRTTRYDVRPNGLLKAQDGQYYQSVSPNEAARFLQAVRLYHQRVNDELYANV